MAKILCLAASGFGKSTGTGRVPELDFIGLDPATTYIISKTSKPLPYAGSVKQWPVAKLGDMRHGRRVICTTPKEAVTAMETLIDVPTILTVVFDDFN